MTIKAAAKAAASLLRAASLIAGMIGGLAALACSELLKRFRSKHNA
jgi:hypothetical protein